MVYNEYIWEQIGAFGSKNVRKAPGWERNVTVLFPITLILRKAVIYMVMFVDEYERQLDERGRIILPSKLRDDVKDTVYITQSPSEKCLHLYTADEWERVAEKVNLLPTATDRNAAAFVRLFFGKATAVTVDKQGRIPIAKRLIDYAGLQKDAVLVGANTRLEIWDAAEWESYQQALSESFMTDGILKYNLNI